MSDTEARAADDATPPGVGSVAPSPPADERETDERDADESSGASSDESQSESPNESPNESAASEPSWWHRSHPTFAGLVGFFTGVAYVILVPGVYAAILSAVVSEKTAEQLFPLVLVALVVPVGMLVPRRTRRFAQFMLTGLVATALVIALTATVVLWVLVRLDK